LISVQRKGKLLCFCTDHQHYILSHLGMSGAWIISNKKITKKHTHLQFEGISNGKKMYLGYVDPRRFGNIYFADQKLKDKKFNELGVDLVSKEYTAEYIYQSLKKYPNRALKVCLLDQSLFAGVGNYIASEICAHARLRPTKKCSTITKKQSGLIQMATLKVIEPTIQSGGTAFSGGYQDANGQKGEGLSHLVVFYQKICQLCKVSPVKKIILGQRGTYYCPNCQR